MRFSPFRKKILLVVLGVVLIQAVSLATFVNRLRNVDRIVAEQLTISDQWQEISLSRPFIGSQQIQFFSLDLEGARRPVNRRSLSAAAPPDSIELADGTVVTPEIQLVDDQGQIHDLHAGPAIFTARNFTIPFYLNVDSLPKKKSYLKLRVRCDKLCLCKQVIWHARV